MEVSPLFAIQTVKTDPDVDKALAVVMITGFVVLLALIAWYCVPILIAYVRNKRLDKIKADNDLWFEGQKSILHRGTRQLTIPESSLEYYVCKLVFKHPKVYQTDLDVLDEAGEDDKNDRAVYFAVDRINNKARRELNLDTKLLKRNKERTRLNDIYF